MKEIVWDRYLVGEHVHKHGKVFVRMKEPRGWKATIRKKFKTVAGKCFRNSLYAALNSNGSLWYCEGFARVRENRGWYAHAWNSPTHLEVDKGLWAVDLTWPFHSKYAIGENVEYAGVAFDADHVLDFIHYLEYRGVDQPTLSIFKYIDYYKEFISGMH